MISLDVLDRLWPHGDQHVPGLRAGIAGASSVVFLKYGVTSTLAAALFMGQFSEECGAGLEMVENMNYSEMGLRKTFPTHFTGTMAHRYAHNPRMIADIAYGGRMGNDPPPSDDGWNYRGKGLSQLTGKEAYAKVGKLLDVDEATLAAWVVDPAHCLEVAVCDAVKICGCLPFAERGDVLGTTKHLNGGTNGLDERVRWTGLWRAALRA